MSQAVQFRRDVLFGFSGQDELHVRDFLNELGTEVRLNVGHGHGLVALILVVDGLLAPIIERANNLHHANGFHERAVAIVIRESVLLEELFLNNFGDLERGLLVLTERIFTNELHNFDEIVLLLQDSLNLLLVHHEVLVFTVEEVSEHLIISRVRNVPVDRGEMLSLGELLVETPEDLHNFERGSSDGIGEITTRRRDGTDNRDGTKSVGRTGANNLTGSLVELSELRTKMRGETLIGGHLSETTRDFSEGLSPSRRRVSHHSDVLAHVSEVLGQRDTSVDGGLSGSDRHVGGVGDEAGTLHDRVLLIAALNLGREGGELFQDLSHLVTTLTATDVDDAIRVGVLGESLRNASLAATEGTGNGASTTESRRVERIEHTLTSQQGLTGLHLLEARSRSSNGPEVRQLDLLNTLGSLHLAECIGDVEVTVLRHADESALHARLNHDAMLREESVLLDRANNIAAEHVLALNEASSSLEGPLFLLVETGHLDTSGDEHTAGDLRNGLERTLNTIENVVEDTCRKIRAN